MTPSFAPPKSLGASGTVVSLFLLAMREAEELRVGAPLRTVGGALRGPPLFQVECTYLVSVWGADENSERGPETEHRLLGELMRIVHANPTLPDVDLPAALLTESGQPYPLRLRIVRSPIDSQQGQFWSSLGQGRPRACFGLGVTLTLPPIEPMGADEAAPDTVAVRVSAWRP